MKAFLLLLAVAATTLGAAQAQSTSPSAPASKSVTGANGKPGGGAAGKVVVSPGGQGHNSGPDPKGKILVAPSTSAAKTGKGAAKPMGKQ